MRRRRPLLCAAGLAVAAQCCAQSYVDKVLDDGPQPQLQAETELADRRGWSRGWRVDYSLTAERGSFHRLTHGIDLSGFVDTPHHGTLSGEFATGTGRFQGPSGAATTSSARFWRLEQNAMPLAGGWFANHALGHLTGPQVRLARGFGRFSLPTSVLEGGSAQWARDDAAQLVLGAGRPGIYSTQGVNGFSSGEGQLLFAGGQARLGTQSTVGLQFAGAEDVPESAGSGRRLSSRSGWAAWRWQGQAPWADTLEPSLVANQLGVGGLDFQLNALTSRSRGSAGLAGSDAGGTWVDARWRSRWLDQAAGLFHLQPGIRWGTFQAASDLRGAYWRGELSTRQWYLNGTAEWTDSVSGAFEPGPFGSLAARHRLDVRNTLFGSVAARGGSAWGRSVQVGMDQANDWGQTQWHLEVLRSRDARAARLGIDHTLRVLGDDYVGLSLAHERGDDLGRARHAWIWGVVGSIRPWTGVSLDANLRGSHGSDARVLNGSVGGSWILTREWTLLAHFSATRGRELLPLAVISPITQATELVLPPGVSSRQLQVSLRYQDRAGSVTTPLGGAPGGAAGALSGLVYFDQNGNGRREATEAGVPDVVIRLDGRYGTRTDAQGRYFFPLVAAGAHRIEIVTDNIPLPWGPTREGPQPVEVQVRGDAVLDFPLKRD